MAVFVSPQTGSVYDKVAEIGGFVVCYRMIDDAHHRIRIQGPGEVLMGVRGCLHKSTAWSHVKDGDHISCVVPEDGQSLANAIADAVRAVMLYTLQQKGGEG